MAERYRIRLIDAKRNLNPKVEEFDSGYVIVEESKWNNSKEKARIHSSHNTSKEAEEILASLNNTNEKSKNKNAKSVRYLIIKCSGDAYLIYGEEVSKPFYVKKKSKKDNSSEIYKIIAPAKDLAIKPVKDIYSDKDFEYSVLSEEDAKKLSKNEVIDWSDIKV